MTTTITTWNGEEHKQVKSYRQHGNLHLIARGGSYDVIRLMEDGRLLHTTPYTGWLRADYDRYFDYQIKRDEWIESGLDGDGPVFANP